MPPRIRNLLNQHPVLPASPGNAACAGAAMKAAGTKCCSPAACPGSLARVHRAYLAGALPEALMAKIDRHLLVCRRCENTWDALTSALEDGPMSRDRSSTGGETTESPPDDCPWGRIHFTQRRRQAVHSHRPYSFRFKPFRAAR